MRGQLTPIGGRYDADIAIMRYMGWDWQALQDAPDDLVEEVAERIRQDTHWKLTKHRHDAAMQRLPPSMVAF